MHHCIRNEIRVTLPVPHPEWRIKAKRTLTGLKWILVFCLSWWMTNSSSAQSHPFLENFSATLYQGRVYLDLTMKAGNTCNGIQIYRATDTMNFSRIGLIPGICGSLTKAESYQFTDEAPVLNQVNYYRLELGAFGLSQIIAIDVPDVSDRGYQIRPHPVHGPAQLFFDKQENVSYQLIIYTQHGVEAHRDATFDSYFIMDNISLPGGIYFFSISPAPHTRIEIRGRMVVVGK
jgi:hypothetical protein